jgi:hypothetical protein
MSETSPKLENKFIRWYFKRIKPPPQPSKLKRIIDILLEKESK